ncbi:response regulator transcription factor [Enterovibrio sp. ZSDZ35]|uniref:Response regulator transcription factor n=1 Tax=Enterovibrio qingdaonensis TaxID=2899818 RepID=A0ABT5QTV0_9GAMM|nr:response regulator transcription factor [Enterovibrio sp. ZSDZ35]MDD1784339.1 response regulator transcription factor [Enterovibrio sp. ZSDZ35]
MNTLTTQSIGTLLVIEPDERYGKRLVSKLLEKGYVTKWCKSVKEAAQIFRGTTFDLLMLSSLRSELNGHMELKQFRKQTVSPIICVAEYYCQRECINSFKHGADDYVTRQQSLSEVVCRVSAVIRRAQQLPIIETRLQLVIDSLRMDKRLQEVTYGGQLICATPIQFKLLWTLVIQQHQILSKRYLSQAVLLREFQKYDRSLDMHLSRIRKKLVEAGMDTERLQTIHGKGYRFS